MYKDVHSAYISKKSESMPLDYNKVSAVKEGGGQARGGSGPRAHKLVTQLKKETNKIGDHVYYMKKQLYLCTALHYSTEYKSVIFNESLYSHQSDQVSDFCTFSQKLLEIKPL